jgi:hypothetical protein
VADRASVGAHRRGYTGDVVAWFGWLAGRDTGALAAGRVHVGLWAATQLDAGAARATPARPAGRAARPPDRVRVMAKIG